MTNRIDTWYDDDFGRDDYEHAIHYLWEESNRYEGRNWPPSKEEVRAKIQSIRDGRAYQNERR